MVFSSIGRSLSHSARSKFKRNVISGTYNGRTTFLHETVPLGNACISGVDGELGLLRGYLTYNGAGKQLVSNTYLSNFKSFLTNPIIRRFFSSQGHEKKNYENYYPKNKKEIPKGDGQKSGSKGGSNAGDQGNPRELFIPWHQIIGPIMFLGFVFTSLLLNPQQAKEVINMITATSC